MVSIEKIVDIFVMMPMMSCGDGKNENYYNMVIIGESMIEEMPPADIHTRGLHVHERTNRSQIIIACCDNEQERVCGLIGYLRFH